MPAYWFILGALAVYRLTHLLNAEDGPFDFVARLRARAGASFYGKLFDCFYCLSLWIAAPAALFIGRDAKETGFLWLALSGGAIVVEKLTNRPHTPPPAVYWEEKGESDVLREETTSGDDAPHS